MSDQAHPLEECKVTHPRSYVREELQRTRRYFTCSKGSVVFRAILISRGWMFAMIVLGLLPMHASLAQEGEATEAIRPKGTPQASLHDKSLGPVPYMRLTKENGEPHAFETAIVRFESPERKEVVVDLIAAVHIGETSYYQDLNRRFDAYDVLLYELVAPEGTVIPKGGRQEGATNPIAWLQDSAKDVLGLASQLNEIDYTKKHFVRADLSPEKIGERMRERGDTAMTVALSAFAEIMRAQNLATQSGSQPLVSAELEDLDLLDLFGNPTKLKRALAAQFVASGEVDQSLGKTLHQMLIVDRNEAALEGLRKQLTAGKQRIGIFYGAAHMPDIEQHLKSDFGFERKKEEWLVAWDLSSNKQSSPADPVRALLDFLNPSGP